MRFYNPRTDDWNAHFVVDNGDHVTIVTLSDSGEATARIFGFNDPHRLQEHTIQHSLEEALRQERNAPWNPDLRSVAGDPELLGLTVNMARVFQDSL